MFFIFWPPVCSDTILLKHIDKRSLRQQRIQQMIITVTTAANISIIDQDTTALSLRRKARSTVRQTLSDLTHYHPRSIAGYIHVYIIGSPYYQRPRCYIYSFVFSTALVMPWDHLINILTSAAASLAADACTMDLLVEYTTRYPSSEMDLLHT